MASKRLVTPAVVFLSGCALLVGCGGNELPAVDTDDGGPSSGGTQSNSGRHCDQRRDQQRGHCHRRNSDGRHSEWRCAHWRNSVWGYPGRRDCERRYRGHRRGQQRGHGHWWNNTANGRGYDRRQGDRRYALGWHGQWWQGDRRRVHGWDASGGSSATGGSTATGGSGGNCGRPVGSCTAPTVQVPRRQPGVLGPCRSRHLRHGRTYRWRLPPCPPEARGWPRSARTETSASPSSTAMTNWLEHPSPSRASTCRTSSQTTTVGSCCSPAMRPTVARTTAAPARSAAAPPALAAPCGWCGSMART